MLQSNVKTKLDGFGNVVNLSDNLFSKSKFSVLNKNLICTDWFEEKFIFPLLTNLSDFYLRFIDDIFLTWNGTKTKFDNLKKNNDCHLKQKSILTPQCLK